MRIQTDFVALADRVAMETRAIERGDVVREIEVPAGWSDAQVEAWLDWGDAGDSGWMDGTIDAWAERLPRVEVPYHAAPELAAFPC